jgi:DNA-dependent protein kinase catalytic subunit
LAISYDSFLHLKNRFISNYAVACAVSYILGIGDRHLDNFLIHIPSATIVLIDFGRSFDYVIDLKMP